MFVCEDSIVWMPAGLLDQCMGEADLAYDLETGGLLMGYWSGTNIAVVTRLVGAGPEARRERFSFEPDQEWQVEKIARHYEASGRRETYIGDWHTHPNAKSGRLSMTDRSVLRRVIETPAARASNPIMMLLYGSKDAWQATALVAALRPRRLLWPKLEIREASLRLYEPRHQGR